MALLLGEFEEGGLERVGLGDFEREGGRDEREGGKEGSKNCVKRKMEKEKEILG